MNDHLGATIQGGGADRLLRGSRRICGLLYLLALAHLAVQRCVFGASISPHTLNELWQLPSVKLMETRPFESIVFWHAYTSGFVAYWVLLIRLFGEANAALVYQWLNIVLGAGVAPAAYLIVLAGARSRRAALVGAALAALSPSIPLYAAWYVYDLPAMALLTFTVACVACYQLLSSRLSFLVVACWLLSALICLRSFFHIGLLALLLIWILSRRPAWGAIVCSLASIVAPLAMYLKNYFLFGVFGASTMLGFNLSKVNVAPLSDRKFEAQLLCQQGVIAPIVARYPLFYPLVHGKAIYSQYGYNLHGSSILTDQDDFNNVNLIRVSEVYGRAAKAMIWARPREYVSDLTHAFWQFCDPPSRSDWFRGNPARIEPYRTIYVDTVDGEWVSYLTRHFAGRRVIPSMVMLILPLLLLSYFGRPLLRNGLSARDWQTYASKHTTELCVAGLLLYATVLGTCCERGENNRYFFYVEPIYICALVIALYRLCCWLAVRRFLWPAAVASLTGMAGNDFGDRCGS